LSTELILEINARAFIVYFAVLSENMGKDISIRIKFFSGIDKELKLENYNPAEGIAMNVPSGKRLKWALKTVGMTSFSSNIYFRSGVRISTWSKLKDGDEITCLKAAGGG
jgi:hypothetical protein